MKIKRKKVEKYNVGGYIQAGFGGAQTLYGIASLPAARTQFERIQAAAPSLETPSQFYENYKNAYDAELANLEDEAIKANLSTSIQALQGAGGRALVGGLPTAVGASNAQRQDMLRRERALRLRAGEQLARAQETSVARKERRYQNELSMANKSVQAAIGNIGAGISSIGTGLMYGKMADERKKENQAMIDALEEMLKEPFIPPTGEYGPPLPPEGTTDTRLQGETKQNQKDVKDAAIDNQQSNQQQTLIGNITSSKIGTKVDPDIARRTEAAKEAERKAGMGMRETMVDNTLTGKKVNEILESATNVGKKENLEEIKAKTPSDMRVVTVGDEVFTIPMDDWQKFEKELGEKIGRFIKGFADAGTGQMTKSSVVQTLKEHGGMITEGEFNHDTNPIDVVHDGVKVAELTGNEVILNPTQTKNIAKESGYARKLFKLFEKRAKQGK
jgi:hypothetical protein